MIALISVAQARVPGSTHSSTARSRTEIIFFQFFFMSKVSSLNSKSFCIDSMFSALIRILAAQCLRTRVFILYHCPGKNTIVYCHMDPGDELYRKMT